MDVSHIIFTLVVVLGLTQALPVPAPQPRNISTWLESPRITNWGEWGPVEYCPENSFVFGFRLKVEADQGFFIDDTALNAIELSCQDPMTKEVYRKDKSGVYVTYIKSAEGRYGNWGTWFECNGGALVNGFELRSEGLAFDTTAANNLAVYCDGMRMEGNGHSWGDWTGPLQCPSGMHICGIRTQVAFQLPSAIDDTALNNVDMACCDAGGAVTYSTPAPPTTTTTTRLPIRSGFKKTAH